MKSFDRLALRCSWVAPVGLAIAILATPVLAFSDAAGLQILGWRAWVIGLGLMCFSVGIVAHLIVVYHIAAVGPFRCAEERKRLLRAIVFRYAYSKWRAFMQSVHPERCSGGTINAGMIE